MEQKEGTAGMERQTSWKRLRERRFFSRAVSGTQKKRAPQGGQTPPASAAPRARGARGRRLCGGLCLTLALALLCTLAGPAAYAETPAERLERLRAEQQEIETGIDRLKDSVNAAQQTKQYYQSLVNNLKAQLETLNEDIDQQRQSIARKNDEVAQKAESVDRQRALFAARLRGMYEFSRQSSLATLLGLEDLAKQLRFTENLQRIAENDTALVERLRAEEAELERQRAELEEQLTALAARQQELTDTAAQYAQAIQQADADITAAEADLQASQAALADKQQEVEQAEAEWQEWVRAEQVDFSFGGVFRWPLPGYTGISCQFGEPDAVRGRPHRGIDIPAPAGTKIYAAADGVVSTNNHSSYGISVKLTHGDGVVSIYAHMSRRAVNDGDAVTQGQLIGYVGSTGWSYGNHLHFEVNVNGQVVSPWPYLTAGD